MLSHRRLNVKTRLSRQRSAWKSGLFGSPGQTFGRSKSRDRSEAVRAFDGGLAIERIVLTEVRVFKNAFDARDVAGARGKAAGDSQQQREDDAQVDGVA